MKIVVPSLGRAGTAASMKWLSGANREIVFAVHENEEIAYSKAYPEAMILVRPESTRRHMGKTRQWIMQQIREPFFLVDDDLKISLKGVPTVAAAFDTLEHHIECGASMASFGQQLYSNIQMENSELVNGDPWVIRNKFATQIYAVDPKVFDTCPLEKLPVYEDIAMAIHAIQSGGGTIASYCATITNMSPPVGGCNSWKTKEIILDSLRTLCDLYPDVCSIQPTNNMTHSKYIGVGLRTAWSKIKRLS